MPDDIANCASTGTMHGLSLHYRHLRQATEDSLDHLTTGSARANKICAVAFLEAEAAAGECRARLHETPRAICSCGFAIVTITLIITMPMILGILIRAVFFMRAVATASSVGSGCPCSQTWHCSRLVRPRSRSREVFLLHDYRCRPSAARKLLSRSRGLSDLLTR